MVWNIWIFSWEKITNFIKKGGIVNNHGKKKSSLVPKKLRQIAYYMMLPIHPIIKVAYFGHSVEVIEFFYHSDFTWNHNWQS